MSPWTQVVESVPVSAPGNLLEHFDCVAICWNTLTVQSSAFQEMRILFLPNRSPLWLEMQLLQVDAQQLAATSSSLAWHDRWDESIVKSVCRVWQQTTAAPMKVVESVPSSVRDNLLEHFDCAIKCFPGNEDFVPFKPKSTAVRNAAPAGGCTTTSCCQWQPSWRWQMRWINCEIRLQSLTASNCCANDNWLTGSIAGVRHDLSRSLLLSNAPTIISLSTCNIFDFCSSHTHLV